MSNATKDFIFQHEELRKQLWCNAWVNVANANDCKSTESATRWADAALKDFDTRFRISKVKDNPTFMKYLVTTKEGVAPFFTEWFDCENHFNSDAGMIVYNLCARKYTTDGENWYDINLDHL